ncbi:ADP-ribosylglycohydrolase family protein [Urbifossiella limnaea]|uniref:ADP-ribosylglycohydrolase n=1 Tax=Urbifossiella limnaea TaxID=2528023 RepID=A0A517XLH8_9BACT|nr:ADP-ribosylglycohydrolase family protein [Urbifossiella limnaea]QDU18365.1 ADP-ribosylglycohydrolase [Urbifossiella limnaea]
MLGGIAGDVIGSVHEKAGTKTTHFDLFPPKARFTDDTVLSVAVADVLLHGGDYTSAFQDYYHRYPAAGYGGTFVKWAQERQRAPYGSWANGSAMRVAPVGWAFDTLSDVLNEAERSAAVTHNHPDGVRGAQAVAAAVFLARTGKSKDRIRADVQSLFGYDLSGTVAGLRPAYKFDVSCAGSVPQSLIAFLDSTGFEDAVRLAVSFGGDADTMAAVAGAVAEAFYGGVPAAIAQPTLARLDDPLREVVTAFRVRFCQE